MRIVPKSCSTKFLFLLFLLVLIYLIAGKFVLKSIYDLIESDDKIIGEYDAVVIENWLTPQTTMIKIADSLYRSKIIRNIYITHFKPNSNKLFTGGEVPKFIHEVINLYVLEFTNDTSLYKKIPIEPEDPITLNLANQVAEHIKSKNYRKIIVLSESNHSQRTKLAFLKAFEKSGIEVISVPVEMGINKENWWRSDVGLSSTFSETIKLIYYWLFVL